MHSNACSVKTFRAGFTGRPAVHFRWKFVVVLLSVSMYACLPEGAASGEMPATAEMPAAVNEPATTAAGRFSVAPRQGTAGVFGTWIVTYVVGDHGIRAGGGIRVELPDGWHSA